ncbi:hypothetical protein [Haliangium sp.]|uniref:hypothetical protein n=1 Tax=Haliangium sp. TaxID=2663208 RepID=UPI003D0A1191
MCSTSITAALRRLAFGSGRLLVVAFAAAFAGGCSGGEATRVPAAICPITAPTPEGRLAQCAIGCDAARPGPTPKRRTAVLWYTVDDDLTLGKRRGKVCADGASMIPSPDRKGTYVVVGGELRVIRPGTAEAVPVEVETGQRGWRFSRLLGFRRWVDGAPILLAEMIRRDGACQLWSVQLTGRRGMAAPVREQEMPSSPQAFFADFQTPRCADEHSRCLVAAPFDDGVKGLGVAPRRGQGVVVKPLPEASWSLIDASWVPGRPGEVVLLVEGACER